MKVMHQGAGCRGHFLERGSHDVVKSLLFGAGVVGKMQVSMCINFYLVALQNG
jgi:hypothetical protein